ncbi:MAG: hypothetical protein HY290_29695 [Planctomycetia bacterium]|nr:hypothetical protein [Planctomycetia bacterium]
MNDSLTRVLTQLLWQFPMFLAYLGCMAAAVVYWSRYPKPSLLVFIASGMLLALVVGQIVIQNAIIAQQANFGNNGRDIGSALNAMGLVFSLLRIVALAMIITAVYTGRTPAPGPEAWVED